jgi:DNA-directed RNA polymerase specialized sigma subunit
MARMHRMHAGWGDREFGHRKNAIRMNSREIPQELREKLAEAKKTAIDLRTELARKPIDREKALELHRKHAALVQEFREWRFNKMLDSITAQPQE